VLKPLQQTLLMLPNDEVVVVVALAHQAVHHAPVEALVHQLHALHQLETEVEADQMKVV